MMMGWDRPDDEMDYPALLYASKAMLYYTKQTKLTSRTRSN